jgi:hypothetical protein
MIVAMLLKMMTRFMLGTLLAPLRISMVPLIAGSRRSRLFSPLGRGTGMWYESPCQMGPRIGRPQ